MSNLTYNVKDSCFLADQLRRGRFLPRVLSGAIAFCWAGSVSVAAEDRQPEAKLVEYHGRVRWIHDEYDDEVTQTNLSLHVGNVVRTLDDSRAVVWFRNNNCSAKLGESSTLRIAPPAGDASPLLRLVQGALYFFSRETTREAQIWTPHATGAPRGTEFVVTVQSDQTILTMLEGTAALTNEWGTINLKSREMGIARDGSPPIRMALGATNVVQWWLYYPGVLEVEELGLSASERQAWASSLKLYQLGDLSRALSAVPGYPAAAPPQTDALRIYLAALYLAAGQVDKTQMLLDRLSQDSSTAAALRWVIAAVQLRLEKTPAIPASASEWLGLSYYYQARNEPDRLEKALSAAINAVVKSPSFAFGWERVAELEFGFGHIMRAKEALDRSLELAPLNAQAHALRGFLLSAENRLGPARQAFEQSIGLDSSLGNAWLGRGLVRNRTGDSQSGRMDLQTAVILEPNRSLLRSYLGKAYADAGTPPKAELELKRAIDLDSHDPTPWLYSALLKQQENRINEAIGELETSQELNENRSLFRSRLLLDEDRAVRSANLASIYRDAGMNDVSVREAARAVTYDYANDSAHLFLSDSYNQLRDPTRFNLRYETVWFNELLLANLLAPVGAGRLSQHVSQQEYSALFQADGLGFANSSLARSDNKSVQEFASQYGTFGGTSYSFDLDYDYQKGYRVNNDLSSIEWYTTVKQQVTPQDTALLLIKYEDYHSGDNFQYYYLTNARPYFRFDEYQHPILVGGWHHEWSPEAHTLLLAGRLENEQHFSDRGANQIFLDEFPNGTVRNQNDGALDVAYRNDLEIYTAELNQIFQWPRITLSAGARVQSGSFNALAVMDNPSATASALFNFPPGTTTNSSSSEDFDRVTGYGYLTLEPLNDLWVTAGVAYDDIRYPRNFRNPPLDAGQDHRSQLGPKAALVWDLSRQVTVRGVFSHSLGGVSLDESYRLEPTQLAGFPQAFRSLISESLVGSVAAPKYKTYGLAIDLKLPGRTFSGILLERLESDVQRGIGLFVLPNGIPPFAASSTLERLGYRENSVSANLNHLAGEYFVFGTSYKFDHVELQDQLPDFPVSTVPTANQVFHSDLHEASGYILFNHPSGVFAQVDATWYRQSNLGDPNAGPGDDFVQENIYAGYRFFHRHAELRLGILNLSDQDYHLSPLTAYMELPRKRSFMIGLKFIF